MIVVFVLVRLEETPSQMKDLTQRRNIQDVSSDGKCSVAFIDKSVVNMGGR